MMTINIIDGNRVPEPLLMFEDATDDRQECK